MKVYTRTGDDGTSGLFGGGRARKSDSVFHALGDLDEANCSIGALRACGLPGPLDALAARAQARLFEVGAEAASKPGSPHAAVAELGTVVADLEASIDAMEEGVAPLTAFILPGGSPRAAQAHLARAVCRRAERSLAALPGTRSDLLAFVNRLSDWLFVLARELNRAEGVAEHVWTKEAPSK